MSCVAASKQSFEQIWRDGDKVEFSLNIFLIRHTGVTQSSALLSFASKNKMRVQSDTREGAAGVAVAFAPETAIAQSLWSL